MANIIDGVTKWVVDRRAYARQYSARALKAEHTPPPRLAATFLERLAQSNYSLFRTVDDEQAQELAATCSWVYSDIQLIANRLAGEAARPVAAYWEDGDWQEDWEHPVNKLLAKPNALISGSFMFRYLAWWYLLSGNAYVFVSTPQYGSGEPQELWPLVANQVEPLPDTLRETSRGLVVDYAYSIRGQVATLPGEHVIHFRTPNPWDYWRGLSPLTASLIAIQADTNRAKWDRDFFGVDNAIPTAVISLPAEITDSDFDRAQEEIRAEFGGRRRTAITRAGDLSIETIQQTLADMQMSEMRLLSRDEIDRVYGVPEGIFSSGSGESRMAVESLFATNTIQPTVDYFAEEWTNGLAWFYGDPDLTLYARPLVPRDKALAIQEYTIYSQDRTINENRSELGLEPIKNPLAEEVPVRLLQWVAPTYPTIDGEEPEKEPIPPQLLPFQGQQPAPAPEQAEEVQEAAQVGAMVDAQAPETVVAEEASKAAMEGIRTELKRWRKVSLHEVRAGRLASERAFVSNVLPEGVAAAVRAGLVDAADEAAVQAAFGFGTWLDRADVVERDWSDAVKADPFDAARRIAENEIEQAFIAGHTDGGTVRQIANRTVAPNEAFSSSWVDGYQGRLRAQVLPAFSLAATNAATAIAGQLGIDWQLVNQAVLSWAQQYGYDLVSGLTTTTQTQLQSTISAWIASGQPLSELTTQLTPIFDNPTRAQAIASTEITRLYQMANEQAWRQANLEIDAGIVGGEWRTARDEKTCFPAWTLIETEDGPLPIQRVKPGMRVQTRQGLKQVVATKARRYQGEMVKVQTDLGSVVATANHPFWTIEHGWLQGSQLDLSHTLETFNQQPVKVLGILDFFLGNATNNPVARLQEVVLPFIPSGVSVPVGAVNFQGDALVWQQKVNRVTSHASFLNELDAHVGQCQANSFLQHGFAVGSPIAGKRTELAVGIARHDTQRLAADPALNIVRRATTLLRTVMARRALFGASEGLSATLADNRLGTSKTALAATNGIAISSSSIDSKGLGTDRANFADHFTAVSNVVATAATETASLCDLRNLEICQRSTDGASYLGTAQRRSVVARPRTEATVFAVACVSLAAMLANLRLVFIRHAARLLTDLVTLYHKSFGTAITVYNLQVKDVPEYYANGILVHNCPICRPLHGQQRSLQSPGYMHPETGEMHLMPAHVRCRCYEVPVLSRPGSRQRGPGPMGGGG